MQITFIKGVEHLQLTMTSVRFVGAQHFKYKWPDCVVPTLGTKV